MAFIEPMHCNKSNITYLLIVNLCDHWFQWWLVTYSVQSHYPNHVRGWLMVNWTLGHKLQWNLNKIQKVCFFQAYLFENVVCKMPTILFSHQCINSCPPSAAFMGHWSGWSLFYKKACCLFSAKSLSEPVVTSHQTHPKNRLWWKKWSKLNNFYW